MARAADRPPGAVDSGLVAVTLDFGNTLVPVSGAALRQVVEATARAVVERTGVAATTTFMAVWAEERERQFREEVPRFHEVDVARRVVRVLARLRGMPAPGPDEPWDDATAARWSTSDETAFVLDAYGRSFVEALPAPATVRPLLERLSSRFQLGVLSNWPLADTIDRYLEAAGWMPYLAAVVVSQRVGTIKPHPAIFRAAEAALDVASPDRGRILHVGDDWAADVVGAKQAGWRAAYFTGRPAGSPLPASERDTSVEPDAEVASLEVLEAAVDRLDGGG